MNISYGIITIAILIALTGCKKKNESPLETLFRLGETAQNREALRLEREKAIQKREREERLAREKEEAVNLRTALSPLIKSRKQRISGETGKLISELKAIAADRRDVDAAISLVEDKRGLECTVFNVMTNQTLNALAVKYSGSDFKRVRGFRSANESHGIPRPHQTSRGHHSRHALQTGNRLDRPYKSPRSALNRVGAKRTNKKGGTLPPSCL